MKVIEAKKLMKIYRTDGVAVRALRGVDFSMDRGEMVVIMGPSGCGKTTLLNCLSGLDIPTSGRVVLDGRRLDMMSEEERTAYRLHHVGFIFQTFNLLPVLTAVENVELPLLLQAVPPDRARKKALEVLEKVGIKERADHLPSQLSGGEQQRVAIARAIITSPTIIFADEPTGNLDSDRAREVMDLLRDLNRRMGVSIVVVTHNPLVASYADRVAVMENGRIVEWSTSV